MYKTFILIGLVPVVLVASFFALNAYIYQEKQEATDESYEPYRATLEGEYVCLPHKDTRGPHTTECAFGVRTDSGEHFAVDFNLMSQPNPGVEVGERFSANGLVTPIENLSTDHWQKYDVEGIFSVTDGVVVEETEPVFCTMDAMMCPDGSYVGRTGPNCEFAACPVTETAPSEPVVPAEPVVPVEPVACTMEAKICPDGSAVGRQGPMCEFAPCPGDVR